MGEEQKFSPSYWSIIREGKKYIGCSNNCEHLKEENEKMKCCYFEKEIIGEEDNYKLCGECFKAYCETKFDFDIEDILTYHKNHFKE